MKKTEKNDPDRRLHPRVCSKLPLELVLDTTEIPAKTINFSCTGICCRVKRHFPLLTVLRIAMSLPFHAVTRTVTCTGVVVRVDPVVSEDGEQMEYEIAIFFNEIGETEKTILSDFVETCRE